ncbi:alpha/beta hydrolase [Frankia sp. CN6]|uniref:Alpha/beta hydrolase n=2 Tax=Frankia nepalensis TaxID=1836974 RepID=A0A937R8U0_9ACTN|nr:alpha/beta hydrolase [Frankia nepalensis]MBL7627798.1 alpha/beta hydrolase [Frankia nepalensis]
MGLDALASEMDELARAAVNPFGVVSSMHSDRVAARASRQRRRLFLPRHHLVVDDGVTDALTMRRPESVEDNMQSPTFHPDLRAARFLPRAIVGPRSLGVVRALIRFTALSTNSWAVVEKIGTEVSVRVFRPESPHPGGPALLWIHGGGMVMGTAAIDDRFCRWLAGELGIIVASVDYRLAPEYPYPVPLHDCYSGLRWLATQPDVDASRIAIGGASAGGGLAAALALLAKQEGEIQPAFQLLVYPMLDDRTSDRSDIDARRLRIWSHSSNRFGWNAYLGGRVGVEVPALAAPARADDLTGLPPAWIGVGTHDLFHDEDVHYAARLTASGVSCFLHEVPGAYHGFDTLETSAAVSRTFREAKVAALAEALGIPRNPAREGPARRRRK